MKTQAFYYLLASILYCTNLHANTESTKIIFLSCIKQSVEQPLWNEVKTEDPDAVLLIGDNVYIDSDDPEVFKQGYQSLEKQPVFQEIRKHTLVSGTWDDHDYGENDGGREWKGKDDAQKAFLDFFKVPEDSPRRQQKGVYSSFMLDEGEHRVQVILLDTRYFRSPLNKANDLVYFLHRYFASKAKEQDMLGEQQWVWLESELQKPADIRIIASSIQFIADNHGFERWGELPKEKKKMLQLLKRSEAKGVIFISGDRHSSELMKLEPEETGLSYPLFDLTSSGFNSAVMFTPGWPTKHQVKNKIYENNFGKIEINWASGNITLDLIGRKHQSLLHHEIAIEALH